MNEIMVRTDKTFQAKELNDAVKGLSKAFQNIDKNRKDACLIMWRLEDGKKYEKDGFKSLFEFAETIGIDKSTAHKMADAGRVYDSVVPEIAQFADKAGYTVAANIASMLKDTKQTETLKDAIIDKSLNEDMTVDKVKSWKADAIAQNKPEKVLVKYEIDFTVFKSNGAQGYHYDAIEFENVSEFEGVAWGSVSIPNGGKVKIGVYPDGTVVKVNSMDKIKKESKPVKPVKKSLDDMTPEELQAWAKSKGLNITFSNVNEN